MKLSFAPLILTMFLPACSDSGAPPSPPLVMNYPLAHDVGAGEPARPQRLPWQVWSSGRDKSGRAIYSQAVLAGDEYFENGSYARALKEYQRAQTENFPSDQRAELMLRLAGAYLALEQPEAALKAASDLFRRGNMPIEEVGPEFSLLFGYSYGSVGNTDQSLAWFTRARQLAGADRSTAQYPERGVRLLLAALSQQEFENLSSSWNSDVFINGLVGQERAKRSRRANQVSIVNRRHFWSVEGAAGANTFVGTGVVQGAGQTYAVGVLLPLTGKFANFGSSVKNGIELAIDAARANSGEPLPEINFADAGVDAAQARSAALELIAAKHVAVILGPLLTEVSQPVSDLARQNNIPLVSFSKSAAFQTGAGIFRLGPTAQSQVSSLLDECAGRLGVHNFAIVYPEDENGREFSASFRSRLNEMGLSPVFETSYMKDDQSALLAIATEFDAYPTVEAIFFPDNLGAAARFYSSMSSASRSRIKLIGAGNWDNTVELANARTAMSGAIFVSPFRSSSPELLINQFVEAYKAKYKRQPDFLAAQGFDAASMVLAALKRQQQETLSFFRAFSEIAEYQGLTGHISVQPDGELARKFRVVQLVGENIVEPPSMNPGEDNGAESATLENKG